MTTFIAACEGFESLSQDNVFAIAALVLSAITIANMKWNTTTRRAR